MAVEITKFQPYGTIRFAERDESVTPARPGVFGEDTCADQVNVALNIEYTEHDSKCGAVISQDYRAVKKANGTASIELTNFTLEALALGLAATTTDAEGAPASVVDEELTEIPDEGGTIALGGDSPNFNITALTIEDSATVPNTLTLSTDYTLNAPFGMVTFGDLSSFVQPLKASYSHQNPPILGALAQGTIERWIRFNAKNRAKSSRIVPVDMFRVQISPTSGLDLLPDDLGRLTLSCGLLIDETRESTDPRGQFLSVGLAQA